MEDDAGHDYELHKRIERNGSFTDTGSILDFQLKCTDKWEEQGDCIKYSLRSKNYNDIVQRNVDCCTPLLLVLMCLPKNDINWVQIEENKIIFRENLFWFHTEAKEFLSNEDSTKMIYISKTQKFKSDTLESLIAKYGIKTYVQR